MKTKTLVIAIAFIALIVAGCHGDNDDKPTGPGDTSSTFDPLKPDVDDTPILKDMQESGDFSG